MLVSLTICAPPLSALNPAYSISQYLHTAWRSDSGLQSVRRLAQTPDGYLWLATRGGLVRFDGFNFSTYLAGAVPGLESSTTQDLLVDPDGSLWIATLGGGVSHYQQGKFRSYTMRDGLPSSDIQALYRDTHGALWVGTRDGKIARLDHGRFAQVPLAIPANSISAFLEGDDRSLWIATYGDGVFRLRDGSLTAFSVHDGLPDARVAALYRDRAGRIWTAGWKGVSSWNGTRFVPDAAANKAVHYAIACREDRDGNLWIAASSGLFRVQGNQVTMFNRDSGLSADFAADLMEDREGDLWVATRGGVDRFRDAPVRTFTARQGLQGDSGPIATSDRGEIWTVSDRQVGRVAAGELSTWPLALPSRAEPATLLPQPGSDFLIGFGGGVVRWNPQGAGTIPALAGLDVRSMLRARDGTIWLGTANRGVLRWKPSPPSAIAPESVLADRAITTFAEDPTGAIWAGSVFGGGLYRITGEKVQHFGPAEGLKSPYVYTVIVGREGDVWVGSNGGLSWFRDGKFRFADSRQGLPSNQVLAMIDDSYGRLWIATFAGIASIEKKSLLEWAEGRREMLNPTVYPGADGLPVYTVGRKFPAAVRSADGHLWFTTADGIAEVTPPDPRLPREDVFPVLIEDVKIDGTSQDRRDSLRVPPGTRSVEIAYTAIALSNPESVRFRYRLDGIDRDWINVGSRRIASYNNLKPGAYTFTVSAATGLGQWRNAPALVLEQLPFFYQTTWFMLLAVTAVVSTGVFVYRLRVQQAIDRIQAGFQERMDERARIAQELHDTVVQAIAGSTMLVESAAEKVPDSLPMVKGTLLRAVDRLDFALAESRAALKGLRNTTESETDLAKQLAAVAADATDQKVMFKMAIDGEMRGLRPTIRYEVFRIGSEAIANALKHSEGTAMRVELGYVDGLRLSVRDNGKGIPADILQRGKDEHFGLQGIRERADRIGAKLAIHSRVGEGTEVEITVPEDVAFDPAQGKPSLLARSLSILRRLALGRPGLP